MKKATCHIIETFPFYEQKLLEDIKDEEFIQSLDQIQLTFFKLACFFESPQEASFDLTDLYNNLDDDWLEMALELINKFFREDTFLIKKPSFSMIKDGSDYLNQSQFANFLTKEGLKYDRQKVNLYLERGKIPAPDLIVGGTKYWNQKSVNEYCQKEIIRLKLDE